MKKIIYITTTEKKENKFDQEFIKQLEKRFSLTKHYFEERKKICINDFQKKEGFVIYNLTKINKSIIELVKRNPGVIILNNGDDLSKYYCVQQEKWPLFGWHIIEKDKKGRAYRWTSKKSVIQIFGKSITMIAFKVYVDLPVFSIFKVKKEEKRFFILPREKKIIRINIEEQDNPTIIIKTRKLLSFIPRIIYGDKRILGISVYNIESKSKHAILQHNSFLKHDNNIFKNKKEMELLNKLRGITEKIIVTNNQDEQKADIIFKKNHIYRVPWGITNNILKKKLGLKNKKVVSYIYSRNKKQFEEVLKKILCVENLILIIHTKNERRALQKIICKYCLETRVIIADTKQLQKIYLSISDTIIDESTKNMKKIKQINTWEEATKRIIKIITK